MQFAAEPRRARRLHAHPIHSARGIDVTGAGAARSPLGVNEGFVAVAMGRRTLGGLKRTSTNSSMTICLVV